jgi:hypothetical protein
MTDLLRELEAQSKFLRKAAAEIAAAGHAGWGNTCLQAAEALDTHHAEIAEALKDKVRMDWLCSDEVHWIEIQSNPRGDYVYVGTDDRTPLRRKIDAATQEGEG